MGLKIGGNIDIPPYLLKWVNSSQHFCHIDLICHVHICTPACNIYYAINNVLKYQKEYGSYYVRIRHIYI